VKPSEIIGNLEREAALLCELTGEILHHLDVGVRGGTIKSPLLPNGVEDLNLWTTKWNVRFDAMHETIHACLHRVGIADPIRLCVHGVEANMPCEKCDCPPEAQPIESGP
jgi:hypothetical protein